MLTKLRFYGVALLIMGLAGCSWFGGKDNSEPPAALVAFTPSVTVKPLWTVYAGDSSRGSYLKLRPVFHAGLIYTVAPNGLLQAIALSGETRWEKRLDIRLSSGVGVREKLLVVGNQEAIVVALNTETGEERWRARLSSEVLAAPQVTENRVVVRTGDGKVYGLSAETGEQVWVYERTMPPLTLRGNSTPLLTQERVLVGLDNGVLAALNIETGKPVWEATVAAARGRSELERMVDIDADPVLYNDTVFVTSFQGRIVALDVATGQLLWQREASSYAGLAVSERGVYLSDSQSHIAAYDPESGGSLWKQTGLQARNITAPAVLQRYVIVGDLEGYVHLLDAEDGSFVARQQVGKGAIIVTPLVIDDKQVLIYDTQGNVSLLEI